MPTIVDFPTIVQAALTSFGDVFDTEAARRHFAEYRTGRMVAERQTVRGITRAFGVTTDQACLHRWLTEVSWDVQTLHDRRLAWLQRAPQTRSSPRGGIAIAKTLVEHAGQLLEDVGWCWEHADARSVIAHDDLIANDVCPSGAHYPIAWQRCKKREACAAGECQDHTPRCIALIDDAVARGLPGDVTCAGSFTSAKVLNHIPSQQRADVGARKLHRPVVYDGREPSLQAVARQSPWAAKQPVRMGQRRYGDFRKQRRLPDVAHPVRVGLFWKARGDQDASKALGSKRLGWEVIRRVLVYRYRWTGTEPLHRDGQQLLGLGAWQVRTGEGQTRHVYLVRVASSLLRRSLPQTHLYDWARRTLTTIGEAWRAVTAETLERIVDWIVDKLTVEH